MTALSSNKVTKEQRTDKGWALTLFVPILLIKTPKSLNQISAWENKITIILIQTGQINILLISLKREFSIRKYTIIRTK